MRTQPFYILTLVGGGNIIIGDPATKINDLNSFFTTAGIGVGVVLLVVGVIKLIMSLIDENPKGKMDASIFIGISAFFLGMSTVVETFKVDSTTTVTNVTEKILTIIADICQYAGFALFVVTILLLIMAFAQEQPESMAKASTSAAVALGLTTVSSLIDVVKEQVFPSIESGADAAGSITDIVVSFISSTVGYVGITLVPLGVFKLIYSIRSEDTQERNTAIKILAVGVTLTAFKGVLFAFGI